VAVAPGQQEQLVALALRRHRSRRRVVALCGERGDLLAPVDRLLAPQPRQEVLGRHTDQLVLALGPLRLVMGWSTRSTRAIDLAVRLTTPAEGLELRMERPKRSRARRLIHLMPSASSGASWTAQSGTLTVCTEFANSWRARPGLGLLAKSVCRQPAVRKRTTQFGVSKATIPPYSTRRSAFSGNWTE
jgi:hypothetical protein